MPHSLVTPGLMRQAQATNKAPKGQATARAPEHERGWVQIQWPDTSLTTHVPTSHSSRVGKREGLAV